MSWLGWLNFIVLQWFFVRLARIVDVESKKTIGWKLDKRIIPLTGWWNNYIRI